MKIFNSHVAQLAGGDRLRTYTVRVRISPWVPNFGGNIPTIKIRNGAIDCKVFSKNGDLFLVSYYFAGVARTAWVDRKWLIFPSFGDYVI